MEKCYKFIANDENVEKIVKLGFCFDNEEFTHLRKPKKFRINNELVQFAKKIYSNPEWAKGMQAWGIDLGRYGLKYEDGKLIEDEEFKKNITKFELVIDLTDDFILSISHCAEFFPVALQNKSILDKFAKEEVRMLKKEGLIEVIEVGE